MNARQDGEPTMANALTSWHEAERQSIRATAQREAAHEASDAARLAGEAAGATADAAQAAQLAAGQASRAATATADAAQAAQLAASQASRAAVATAEAAAKVLQATHMQGLARRVVEQEALEAERTAHEIYREARERAGTRHGQGSADVEEQAEAFGPGAVGPTQ